jgi:hypothetical protein
VNRTKGLQVHKPMNRMSDKQRERLAAKGVAFPTSTLISHQPMAAKKPSTGPKRDGRELLAWRSSGLCEWPEPLCPELATDAHHRLNRKAGGRHGDMRDKLNGVEWLLHACRTHHAYVTSPYGHRRRNAIAIGWLLLEGQEALRIPVLTRHDEEPIWLLPDGSFIRFEEASA